MSKKKWALAILAVLMIFACVKLFYKTYSEKNVPASADCIVAIDVKRIINTALWNFITTPSQWKIKNPFSGKGSDAVSLRDMFVLPDYIFVFHCKGQPAGNWYSLVSIKDKADFDKGMLQYKFEKINDHDYRSSDRAVRLHLQDGQVLLSSGSATDTEMAAVAKELFTEKKYIAASALSKTTDAASHVAMLIQANEFLEKDALIRASFNKKQIEVAGDIVMNRQYVFNEDRFNFSSASLCSSGFVQPSPAVWALLDSNSKQKISKALNMQVDSVFKPGNKSYSLDLAAIVQRADSAISYTYDDEFNKVEKVVVNNIQEPAFSFILNGDSVPAVYTHLLRDKKLEKTGNGFLFTPMPFVKSYCSLLNEKQLAVTAFNYTPQPKDRSINAVLFLELSLSKIPPGLKKYLPDAVISTISNLEALKVAATKHNEQIALSVVLQKMDNDLPVLKF